MIDRLRKWWAAHWSPEARVKRHLARASRSIDRALRIGGAR